MRLIDADALKDYMRKALEETRNCYPDRGAWAEAITEEFCKDIDEQPTIEPQRKKGKWIEEPGMIMCGECGDAWGAAQTEEVMSFNYCPYCGADMRGEQNAVD